MLHNIFLKLWRTYALPVAKNATFTSSILQSLYEGRMTLLLGTNIPTLAYLAITLKFSFESEFCNKNRLISNQINSKDRKWIRKKSKGERGTEVSRVKFGKFYFSLKRSVKAGPSRRKTHITERTSLRIKNSAMLILILYVCKI